MWRTFAGLGFCMLTCKTYAPNCIEYINFSFLASRYTRHHGVKTLRTVYFLCMFLEMEDREEQKWSPANIICQWQVEKICQPTKTNSWNLACLASFQLIFLSVSHPKVFLKLFGLSSFSLPCAYIDIVTDVVTMQTTIIFFFS